MDFKFPFKYSTVSVPEKQEYMKRYLKEWGHRISEKNYNALAISNGLPLKTDENENIISYLKHKLLESERENILLHDKINKINKIQQHNKTPRNIITWYDFDD